MQFIDQHFFSVISHSDFFCPITVAPSAAQKIKMIL